MYPFKLHSNGVLAICPKNKPFFAETLKAGKAVAEPPKLMLTRSIISLSYDGCPFNCAIYAG
jgi:hypothetical protein